LTHTFLLCDAMALYPPHSPHSITLPPARGVKEDTMMSSRGANDVDSSKDSGHAALETLVSRLHEEVMQKLEEQHSLLRRAHPLVPSMPILFDPQGVGSVPSMSSGRRDGSSQSSAQDATESRNSSSDPYKTVCTYTSFDMQLREGADTQSGTLSRKQFAEITKQVQGDRPKSRSLTVKHLVEHKGFDIFFGIVVLTNAAFLGIDLQLTLTSGAGDQLLSLRIIQYLYAFLFAAELLLRVVAHRTGFLFSDDWMWSLLDIFIVMTSLWEVIAGILQDVVESDVGSINGISSLKAARIIRLTRILKTVRVIRLFRFVLALRTLITSIFSTMKSLFWALMLLTLIVYVFAILFAQAINDYRLDGVPVDDREQLDIATEKYFGDLSNTMLSLYMSIVGGVSWEEVIVPLKLISPMWVMVFVFYISFTYLAVLNVVTGVFCQSAIDSAQSDQAMMVQNILDDKQSHLQKINALFNQLGSESTGAITYEMFEEKLKSPAVQQYFQTLGLDVWDAWSFFKLLDQDAGGSVEVEEFLMGCLRLRGHATAIDVVKILQDQAWIIQAADQFHKFVHQELAGIKDDILTMNSMLGHIDADHPHEHHEHKRCKEV